MLDFKKIITVFFVCNILLCSCAEQRFAFDQNKNVDTILFKDIPAIAQKIYPDHTITAIDSVCLYRATFKETYVENNDLLEWSELNDSSAIPRVKYYSVKGYYQHLYLAIMHTIPDNINAAVFFSAKYNSDGECVGFGPAYAGIVNPAKGIISFPKQLSIAKAANDFVLTLNKKQDNERELLFISADFKTLVQKPAISLEKIILLGPNKIGGYKPVVFSIPEVLHDKNALKFRYIKTLIVP